MSPTDDRVEQSASPTTMARALRKDYYEERSCSRQSKFAANASVSRSPTSLPLCPKCRNEQHRGPGGYLRPEDLTCDCDCGFVVDDDTALFPCDFPPGSPEKMAVVSARYRLGLAPFLEGDRSEQFSEALVAWACGDEQAEDE